ncbi:MAG: hypothetical protein OSB05_12145 [Akkermansiaceae bacterium]|nr:hypothetical protein [Akkermansiaceae bacterium]
MSLPRRALTRPRQWGNRIRSVKGSLPAKRRRALMNRSYRERLLSLDRARLSRY